MDPRLNELRGYLLSLKDRHSVQRPHIEQILFIVKDLGMEGCERNIREILSEVVPNEGIDKIVSDIRTYKNAPV